MTLLTLNETADFLRERDGFLILTHRAPDGDTLGSAAALCNALRELGKSADLLVNAQTTAMYLADVEQYFSNANPDACTLIAVDSANASLLQYEYGDVMKHAPVALAIDHHPSHAEFADRTLLDPVKSSCGEIVLELIHALNAPLSCESAKLLYIAVSTDTGCFRYKNTTESTLLAAAELIRAGAPNGALNHRLFMVKRMSRLRLEAMMLATLELYIGGELAVATITRGMMRESGADVYDLEDVATVAGSPEGVEMSVTLREQQDGGTKVSVRTVNFGNANALCAYLGGGGHGMAAGATVEADLATTKSRILDAVNNVWKGDKYKL
ncbi:MAG: DHH family phosphoesterase [Oscillospiraceae bacterium]|jgi:phosphoesterase RecJ-like protein|nr:DHH family phosphoesterase [Oscillospiraceae bacterium]